MLLIVASRPLLRRCKNEQNKSIVYILFSVRFFMGNKKIPFFTTAEK